MGGPREVKRPPTILLWNSTPWEDILVGQDFIQRCPIGLGMEKEESILDKERLPLALKNLREASDE